MALLVLMAVAIAAWSTRVPVCDETATAPARVVNPYGLFAVMTTAYILVAIRLEERNLVDEFGADAARAFMINSPVLRAEPLRFSEDGVREVVRTVLLPLWNTFSFFTTYADADGITAADLAAGRGRFAQPRHRELKEVLWNAGVTHYDVASIAEVRLVRAALPEVAAPPRPEATCTRRRARPTRLAANPSSKSRF